MSILVDTNGLLDDARPDAPEQKRSRRWLSERFADADSFVGLSNGLA